MNKSELKKKIGQRIIAMRTRLGWSQSDLARACSKDRQAIEKLENGKSNPTLYTLYELATAMEISVGELADIK